MVGGGEGVSEVTTVAVGAGVASEDHSADFGLVAGMADHRPELANAVGELAVVAVGAVSGLLPLVAQLRLEHPLVVHLQLQCAALRRSLLLLGSAGAAAADEHPLLLTWKNKANRCTLEVAKTFLLALFWGWAPWE